MRILIVEDDPEELKQVLLAFTFDDAIETAATLDDAVKRLKAIWPDLVITDAIFPTSESEFLHLSLQFNAGSLLDEIGKLKPKNRKLPEVLLISGASEAAKHAKTVEGWLAAGRLWDMVPKGGFPSWPLFRAALAHKVNALRSREPWLETMGSAADAYREMADKGIVTGHPSMARVWEVIRIHAADENQTLPLYIHGEAGSGKELFVNAVAALKGVKVEHYNCNRPANTLAPEVFGTVKGIFADTGTNPGLFDKAGDGVLNLDQFCSIDSNCQSQLLRALEPGTRDYHPVGGASEYRSVKCKIIVSDTPSPTDAFRACNDQNAKKFFIEEMYSRLKFFSVAVPPLRERRSDIPLLSKSFLARFNATAHKAVRLSSEVLARFADGPWRGNVRGLHDIVQMLVQRGDGLVEWHDVLAWIPREILTEELGPSAASTREPGPWSAGTRAPQEEDESAIKESLIACLPKDIAQLVDELGARLKQRPANNPGRHLFYAALLFIAQDVSRKATAADLATALCIGTAQRNNLCSELERELANGLSELCVCDRETNMRKYVFTMP